MNSPPSSAAPDDRGHAEAAHKLMGWTARCGRRGCARSGRLRRVGTRGAGFDSAQGRLRVGGVLCRAGAAGAAGRLCTGGMTRGLLGGLCRGCRGCTAWAAGSAVLRFDRDRAGLVSCCGRLAAAGSGSGLGAADGVTAGSCRTPGPGSRGTSSAWLPPGGRPASAWRRWTPPAWRGAPRRCTAGGSSDDAAAAGGIRPGRGPLGCGAPGFFRCRGRRGGRLAGLYGGKGGLDPARRHPSPPWRGDLEHLPGDVRDN